MAGVGGRQREPGLHGRCALEKEADGLRSNQVGHGSFAADFGQRERWNQIAGLADHSQPFSTGGHDFQSRRHLEERCRRVRARLDQVLTVVQDEQQVSTPQRVEKGDVRRPSGLLPHVQDRPHRGQYQSRIGQRRQLDQPDTVRVVIQEISRNLHAHPELPLRMGINSGPVDQVSDVNDRRNVAGAGINMAQRVMDCADAGHILLSKRVADDLEQYTEWQPYLHSLGELEVKHGLHLEVANLFGEDFGNPKIPGKIARAAKTKRKRIVVWLSAALLFFLFLTIGSWIWQRRVALTSAYKVGAAGIIEKSIAVLPFENLSDEKQNAYFADGVQDDILTDLAKVADLKVISRRSVAQYRGSTTSVRDIGQALQVAYVLEGTVRKINGKIRVTAQLIDTRTEAERWGEKYERDLADVFAMQSEISEAILGQLKATLSPKEKSAIEEKPTQDQEAYDLYLRARALVYEFGVISTVSQANTDKAIILLQSAIARDPKFTLAYCLMSEAQLDLYAHEYWNKERLPSAKEAVDDYLQSRTDTLTTGRVTLHLLVKRTLGSASPVPGRSR